MQSKITKTPAGVLKATPKWIDVLPLFLQVLAEGQDPIKIDMAHSELRRMAKAADQLNEIVNKPTA